MAIVDYASLQAAIAGWLARSDLTAAIPDLIRLAELDMGRQLRVRWMETRSQAATTPGDPWMDLPDDFLEARTFVVLGNNGNADRPLAQLAPTDLARTYSGRRQASPASFTLLANRIKLGPAPDTIYTTELVYYARLPALDGIAVNSNWALANFPDLYLWGSLANAAPYIGEDSRLQTWLGLYSRAIAAVQGEDERAKWSGAPLQQRIDMRIG